MKEPNLKWNIVFMILFLIMAIVNFAAGKMDTGLTLLAFARIFAVDRRVDDLARMIRQGTLNGSE